MFDSEKKLIEYFKKEYSHSFLKNFDKNLINRFLLLEEFDSQNGVADIVFGIFKPYAKRTKRKPVNINWVNRLANLEIDKIVNTNEYATIFGISNRSAQKQLDDFTNADFLKCLNKNNYYVKNNYKPFLETVIAIEAKLKNWGRALKQAYRYKQFSNFSFVLLDKKYSNPAVKNIDLFKKYNIGLIVLGLNNFSIIYSPARRNRLNSYSFNRVNETVYSHYSLMCDFGQKSIPCRQMLA